jgi:zinc protease
VTHDAVVDRAAQHFGPFAAGPAVPNVSAREPEQRGERTVRIEKDVQLPGVILGFPAPEATAPTAPALNVAEAVLFRGRSSRLYQRLIYQEALATDLGGGFYLRRDPSTFYVRATARPGVEIETIKEAIQGTLEGLVARPPSEREIEKARHQLESEYVFGQEHNFELAMSLASEECRSSWRDFFRFQEACLAVTPEQVAEVAASVFAVRKRTVGYLVPVREGDPEELEPMGDGGLQQ